MGDKAAKSKRPAYDLNAAGRRRDLLVRIGLTSIVVLFAVVPVALHAWGVVGIAWGMTAGLAAAGLWMLYRAVKPR